MGLLERVEDRRAANRGERRALEVPWRPWDNRYVPYSAGGPAHPSEMAVGVDHALQLGPLYSGARLLADLVACLPLKQYRKIGGKQFLMGVGSLFTKPAAYGTVYDWLHMMMTSLVLTGNAWGLITARDGYGFPTSIEWLPPDRMQVINDQEQPWNPLRSRIYFYGADIPKSQLFHVRGFTVPGRIEGLSPLRLFMELIQAGQDALGYGSSWYRSGGFPPGTFQNMEIEVDQGSADEIRRRLTQTIQRREPLVYGRDWDFKPITVPPNEAQFIEAMQLNATQIAAILGLPPERIGGSRGDSLTYSTVEQNAIELLTDTLRPWLVRLETAFFDCLPEAQLVRFDADAMLRFTIEQKLAYWKATRDYGLLTQDEIREDMERDPLPGKAGSVPMPQEVLVAMARSIREVPKVWSPLLDAGVVDKEAMKLAEAGAAPPPGSQLGGESQGGGGGGGGDSGYSGGGDTNPISDIGRLSAAATARALPGGNGHRPAGDPQAAADAARRRWPGDYQLDYEQIRALMNGASAH